MSISIVVPAYNEEVNLSETIDSINASFSGRGLEMEIIIVNDGSQDKTAEIADSLAANDPKIRAVHLPENMGLGNAYFTGVREARKDYIVMIPGDNECGKETLDPILDNLGEAEMLVPYPVNSEVRSGVRRWISSLFTSLVNLLSGLDVLYYNGTVAHQRELLQRCPVRSSGFAYQAKIIIYMIYAGVSYKHIPIRLNRKKERASSAFRVKNMLNVGGALFQILGYRLFRKDAWF